MHTHFQAVPEGTAHSGAPRRLTSTLARRLFGAGLLLIGLACSVNASAAYNQSLTRTLDAGQIYGKADASNTQAFLGVPFSQSPVGNLRWQQPLPTCVRK